MVRLIGFFVLVWVVMAVLRNLGLLPGGIGGLFSFWIVAIALSLALNQSARLLTRRRRLGSRVRDLGNVESPHNQGKLGSLLLAHGRPGRAVEHLERAAAGEPDLPEWHYRLGQALVRSRRPGSAIAPLRRATELDPEHAYGAAQLALAQALFASGDAQASLAALDTFERNHGASPESAYRRGLALKRLGRRQEAAASLRQVWELASRAAHLQRESARGWVVRALLARLA